MPVERSKIRWGYESWRRWVFNWRQKVCNDDYETTASGRPFQTWAAATGKARLLTVDSLMGGATRLLVLADRRVRRPGRSATATRGPRYRGSLSWSTLYVSTAILYCMRSRTRSQCSVANASETVVVRSQVVDESCRRVEHRLQSAYQVGWYAS